MNIKNNLRYRRDFGLFFILVHKIKYIYDIMTRAVDESLEYLMITNTLNG